MASLLKVTKILLTLLPSTYFKTIPAKTKTKIQPFRHPYLHYLNKCKPVDDYLVLEYTNKDEVYKHIIKLKNNSSSGPIDVPNQFLKLIAIPIASVMCCIINRSIYSGYVPKQMKIGKQTPVHKGGEVCISNTGVTPPSP